MSNRDYDRAIALVKRWDGRNRAVLAIMIAQALKESRDEFQANSDAVELRRVTTNIRLHKDD